MASNNMNEYELQPRTVDDVLGEIRQINPKFSPVYKKVFVSYCKEDSTDPYWINTVYQFVYCLLALGIDVSVDFLDHSGGNLAFGIANKIELCDKILMINSPEYYKLITNKDSREDQASRSVAFEGQLIYSEIFKRNGKKVVPIFLKEYPHMLDIIPSAFKMNINYKLQGGPTCLDLASHSIHKFTQLTCSLIGLNIKDWRGAVNLNSCKPIKLLEMASTLEAYPDLDRPLSEGSPEEFLSNLVPFVIPFWQCLALELEVNLKKVTEMYSKESEKEQCYQSLYQWWKRQPEATYKDLISGLSAVIGVDTRMLIMRIEMYAVIQQQTVKEQGQNKETN